MQRSRLYIDDRHVHPRFQATGEAGEAAFRGAAGACVGGLPEGTNCCKGPRNRRPLDAAVQQSDRLHYFSVRNFIGPDSGLLGHLCELYLSFILSFKNQKLSIDSDIRRGFSAGQRCAGRAARRCLRHPDYLIGRFRTTRSLIFQGKITKNRKKRTYLTRISPVLFDRSGKVLARWKP